MIISGTFGKINPSIFIAPTLELYNATRSPLAKAIQPSPAQRLNLQITFIPHLLTKFIFSMQAQTILAPDVTHKAYTAVLNLKLLFSRIPVEAILLLRIVAVYHPRSLRFLLPLPTALNVARVANMMVAIWVVSTRSWNFVIDWNHLPFSKVEWMLQLVTSVRVPPHRVIALINMGFNYSYVSGAFLYRWWTRDVQRRKNRNENLKVAQRMRIMWLIAISNFVFPCILQIFQVGVVFQGPTKGQSEEEWFNECSIMMIVNGYVTIAGVVFATVWAGANNWAIKEGGYWAKIPTTPMSVVTPSSSTFSDKLNNLPEEGAE
ncbi:hypothetical protein B0H11DRAFT_2296947 [Mycena galericulata]|nr:hypothetical protein B0H11DRAFT_2296947 [Mycena galericulata]